MSEKWNCTDLIEHFMVPWAPTAPFKEMLINDKRLKSLTILETEEKNPLSYISLDKQVLSIPFNPWHALQSRHS